MSWLPESDRSWRIEIKLRLMEIKCLFTLATKHILGFCPSSWRGIPQVQHCWRTMTTYWNSAVWRDDICNEHRQVWPWGHSERKTNFILQHTWRETTFRCGRFCCFVCSVIHYHHQAPRKSARLWGQFLLVVKQWNYIVLWGTVAQKHFSPEAYIIKWQAHFYFQRCIPHDMTCFIVITGANQSDKICKV